MFYLTQLPADMNVRMKHVTMRHVTMRHAVMHVTMRHAVICMLLWMNAIQVTNSGPSVPNSHRTSQLHNNAPNVPSYPQSHHIPEHTEPQRGHHIPEHTEPQRGHQIPEHTEPQRGHQIPEHTEPQRGHQIPEHTEPQRGHHSSIDHSQDITGQGISLDGRFPSRDRTQDYPDSKEVLDELGLTENAKGSSGEIPETLLNRDRGHHYPSSSQNEHRGQHHRHKGHQGHHRGQHRHVQSNPPVTDPHNIQNIDIIAHPDVISRVPESGEESTTKTEEEDGGGDSPVAGERPMDLQAMVRTLQEELRASRTSQVRTRSVLNRIEERQVSQDRDLSYIKAELASLRQQRDADHAAMEVMQGTVSDASWGIADLKVKQRVFQQDINSLKHLQEAHNATVAEMDRHLSGGESGAGDHVVTLRSGAISHQGELSEVRTELDNIKTVMAKDRMVLGHLHRLLNISSSNITSSDDPFLNKIPAVPNFDPTSVPWEGSGETGRVDNLASVKEEEDNSIGHNLRQLMQQERHMHRQVEGLQTRFLQYDAEMARIYAMYYNLSLQITAVENRLLHHQQHRFEHDLSEMQKSFLNFTHQIMSIEQFHSASKVHFNTTIQNRDELDEMTQLVENHGQRIRAMETLMLDSRSMNQQNAMLAQTHMQMMNTTMQQFSEHFADHSHRSRHMFDDIEAKIIDYNTRIKHNEDRLVRLELHTLNTTLGSCTKDNTDLRQNSKLSDFSLNLDSMQGVVNEQKEKIHRVDRGLAKLYQEVEKQGSTLGEVSQQTKSLLSLPQEVTTLQDEVNNFILHLPRDCDEQLSSKTHKEPGSYLIKPDRSSRSVRAYCQVGEGGPWTVIQRRVDGTVSFARSWEEYRLGFGNPDSEFWMGNDNLHYLTTQGDYQLQIDMWDLSGIYRWARYDYFKVDEASTNYRLHVDGYHGNATDALRYSNFMPFSTQDRDNDVSSTHCAKFYTAGWWYKHCHYSNLNGRYTVGVVWFDHEIDEWIQLKSTVMKLRPLRNETQSETVSNQIQESSGSSELMPAR